MNAMKTLIGVVDAATNGYMSGLLDERGRGFASDAEGWAELKKQMELIKNDAKQTEKLLADLWESITEENPDAFSAFCGQLALNARTLAVEWTRAAALAEIALEGQHEP